MWNVCPTCSNILLAAVKFSRMEELLKDKFKIINNSRNDCELMCYVNIDKHILVRVQCWEEGPTEDFDGNYETIYNDASIELTKDMAIRLRDELDRLIKSNYCPVKNETCINSEICQEQGFCSRCD